jgi:hypothetical protein
MSRGPARYHRVHGAGDYRMHRLNHHLRPAGALLLLWLRLSSHRGVPRPPAHRIAFVGGTRGAWAPFSHALSKADQATFGALLACAKRQTPSEISRPQPWSVEAVIMAVLRERRQRRQILARFSARHTDSRWAPMALAAGPLLSPYTGTKPAPDEFVVKEYLPYYRANRRPQSVQRHETADHAMQPTFAHQRLSAISPLAVERYKRQRKADGVSKMTIHRELACLKSVYQGG